MSTKKDRYRERVLTLHRQGKTCLQIAESVGGISKASVRRWLVSWGLTPVDGKPGRPRKAVSLETFRGQILGFHAAGFACSAIVARLKSDIDTTVEAVADLLHSAHRTPHPERTGTRRPRRVGTSDPERGSTRS